MNQEIDFQPVLLGSDINVYGMARSFHQEYGVKSVAIGKGILGPCTASKIVNLSLFLSSALGAQCLGSQFAPMAARCRSCSSRE